MNVTDAFQRANEILVEERMHQTAHYSVSLANFKAQWDKSLANVAKGQTTTGFVLPTDIYAERKMRPRPVHENPKSYEFSSVNYSLLLTIYNQVQESDRPEFIANLLQHLPMRYASPRPSGATVFFPVIGWACSELPLLAEFCVRTGHTVELLEALQKPPMPTFGLAILMAYMEEMIALNFNLFSDKELNEMPAALAHLREIAERQTYSARGSSRDKMVPNPHYKQGYKQEGEQIYKAIDGIIEECRKARYFYLKGVLQQTPNLEVENDKATVIGVLGSLGFDPLLTASLQKAEELYTASSDAFDLKSCLGHLRSFLEELHIQSAPAFAAPGEAHPAKWGASTTFLRSKGVISPKDEAFITSLYTLVSDEAIHPLIAPREYCRLFRNIVIEYGLLFLTTLQNKGVTVAAALKP
jgi:hypothetical protein